MFLDVYILELKEFIFKIDVPVFSLSQVGSGLVGGVGTIGPACKLPSLPLTGTDQVGRKPKQVFWRRCRAEEAPVELRHGKPGPAIRLAPSMGLDLLAITDSPVSVIQAGFVKTISPLHKNLGIIFYISSLWTELEGIRGASVTANRT